MPTPNTQSQELLAQYAAGPDLLESAIAGLSEAGLDHSLTPESWTVRQIIHHITDGDDLWKNFIKQAAGAPGTVFALEWYWTTPQSEWVELWGYARRGIIPSLALFRASRASVTQILSAVPDAWERCLVIRFPRQPEESVSIADVIAMQTRHAAGHIEEIQKIRTFYKI